MKVVIEKPIIHENVLDLFGKEFKFDHAKGIAELLKNSVDAYTLEDVPDAKQQIIVLFYLQKKSLKSISVLDFVGMTKKKIDEAYKRWFDPSASKVDAEAIKKEKQTLGGHGNGGKFYLREMFKYSKIVSYRNGKLNVFGFDENRQFGFDPDYTDVHCSVDEAIEISELFKYPNIFNYLKEIIHKKKKFSIVIGENPKPAQGTNNIELLFNKLVSHPQARRIIQWKKVYYSTNYQSKPIHFTAPKLIAKKNFENPFQFTCPERLIFDGEEIIMYKNISHQIKLTLKTSEEPLKGLKYRGWNSIDFLGEVGVLANYEIHELGNYFKTFLYSDFIYGECSCPIMQIEDYVRNDRSKFTEGPKKDALLEWVRSCVEEVCIKMEEQARKEHKHLNLKQTSELNKLLNQWKNRFLQKTLKEKLGGMGILGVEGSEEIGWSVNDKSTSTNRNEKKIGDQGGTDKRKRSTFPVVLISSFDKDPETGETVECDPRHNAIYQRPIDVKRGIYWINTSKKFAQQILEKYGSVSVRWREYLFQRYIDIIIKEYLIDIGKVEVNLTSDFVTNELEKKISEILDSAVEDLERFLFQEEYKL